MLTLRGVDYSIGEKRILQDVHLDVGEQETLAILGASGSGKSTILKIMLGLLRPDRGEVKVLGREITRLPYEQLVELRKRLGIVFQEGALFDSLTVGENVAYYYLEHTSRSHGELEPLVRNMLRTVGLEETMDMMPEELSGGMRRRVAIARALIYEPAVILYDEPTTGLDPLAAGGILELINRLKHQHRVTSVVVTHALDDALTVADRFAILRDGSVVWSGTKRQFSANRKRMLALYYRPAEDRAGVHEGAA